MYIHFLLLFRFVLLLSVIGLFYYLCVLLFSNHPRKILFSLICGAALLLSVFLLYYSTVSFTRYYEIHCCCMGCY